VQFPVWHCPHANANPESLPMQSEIYHDVTSLWHACPVMLLTCHHSTRTLKYGRFQCCRYLPNDCMHHPELHASSPKHARAILLSPPSMYMKTQHERIATAAGTNINVPDLFFRQSHVAPLQAAKATGLANLISPKRGIEQRYPSMAQRCMQ
jgi:hypothetical protein